MKRFLIFCFSIALIISLIVAIFGFNFTISNGDFQGLKIGMSKMDVVTQLSRQGIKDIVPEVDEAIIIKSESINQLNLLMGSREGICISNNKGFDLKISFDNHGVSQIAYHSASADLAILGLQTPLTKTDVINQIRKIISSSNGFTVTNCILGVRNIHLQNLTTEDMHNIEQFNSWFYYIPRSYSTATLKFTEGKLARVIYRWRPFELP